MLRSESISGATEYRIILQVRYLLLGNSQKQISLTQLPNLLPGALVAPARLGILAAKLK
jgi:hypothetical protein